MQFVVSRLLKRSMCGAVVSGAVVAVVGILPGAALAAPEPADDASGAAERLRVLSRDAEVLTEEYKQAQDDHAARLAELAKATGEAGRAEQIAGQARAEQGRVQGRVDDFANASYRGARMNKLSALLLSESPNDFLDRASALEVLARDNDQAIETLSSATDRAQAAEGRAQVSRDQAARAEGEAARLVDDIAGKKATMDDRVAEVKQQYDSLSGQEKDSLAGDSTDVGLIGGSGAAVAAVNAALGKQGSPYVYGAKGPSQFDCSGLVQWSYEQAGVELPASTRTQVQKGQAVSEGELKPGDVIFFYSPISHNGIYIGGGKVVHAPTEGQDVKVESYEDIGDVNTIRRFAG